MLKFAIIIFALKSYFAIYTFYNNTKIEMFTLQFFIFKNIAFNENSQKTLNK